MPLRLISATRIRAPGRGWGSAAVDFSAARRPNWFRATPWFHSRRGIPMTYRTSSLLSAFAGLPARRISRALGAGGAALLLAWALQPGAWAHNDRIVTTPSGERVRVYHVTLHTAVERDFHEYLDGRGRRVRHGLSKIYYVNGWMREYITFRHGVPHGPFFFWHDRNVVQIKGSYRDGKLHGPVIRYYDSGIKRHEATYRDGELHGPFIRYDERGRVRERGDFRDGKRDGPFVEYRENGKPLVEATYREDVLNGPITLYDAAGRPAGRGIMAQARVRGPWMCLAADGGRVLERTDCEGRSYWECPCD